MSHICTNTEKAFSTSYKRQGFWLKDPTDVNQWLATCRFKSVLFDATCSAFIMSATLLKHMDDINTDEARPFELLDVPNDITHEKRNLRQSTRIYDLLRIHITISIWAKILIQELWKQKFIWDKPLLVEIQNSWKELATDFEKTETKLKWQYINRNKSTITRTGICWQLSKSERSTRFLFDEKGSYLVIAKIRMSPLKQWLYRNWNFRSSAWKTLSSTLDIETITYWSDSKIVLHWLTRKKQLTEINSLKGACQWRYCPTTTKNTPIF